MAGMDLLAARSVTVINMSLAGPPNTLLAKMVTSLTEDNLVLVAAAGNGGPRAQGDRGAGQAG
ncbi:hypothetical protein MNBD_ALPHA09-2252 [hydrothermal vent metagenome]|uniref:Peptidase S8/S53 domain-containing protein n=1 Tax=hydrothermal vent metagenome TaxID=652676 RepID=A0A3B0TB72_9ZZZZ